VEDIAVAALVLCLHGDAVFVGLIEFLDDLVQGFFAFLGVLMPEDDGLARGIDLIPIDLFTRGFANFLFNLGCSFFLRSRRFGGSLFGGRLRSRGGWRRLWASR